MTEELSSNYARLRAYVRAAGRVGVAFSGGVDSTLLLKVAHDELGDDCLAFTLTLTSTPKSELSFAQAFCQREGIEHIRICIDELAIPGFSENPPNRCYLCKRALFSRLKEEAAQRGCLHIFDGSNTDDRSDYRPGMRALSELDIESPFLSCDFSKADVRALSHELGLASWDKPSAACLSSRIPYFDTITREKLMAIDAAENYLRELGFSQLRVRMHGELARIEVAADEIERLARSDVRAAVSARLTELGFSYVTLDLRGFRSGSLNEVLEGQN